MENKTHRCPVCGTSTNVVTEKERLEERLKKLKADPEFLEQFRTLKNDIIRAIARQRTHIKN